jgi:hypothetical protein
MLAFFKNRCGNKSLEEFYAQGDDQHIIQLADDWDEIRDKLNRTGDIESSEAADKFDVPRNSRVNQRTQDDAILRKQLAGSSLQSLGQALALSCLLFTSLHTNFHSLATRLPRAFVYQVLRCQNHQEPRIF